MRISESPLLPEANGADSHWTAPLPPFDGGADADLVAVLAARINTAGKRRLMSDWAILAFLRATRVEFPEGDFTAGAFADQDAVARRVGYTAGSARLSMARKVMESLTELKASS